MKHTPGPWSLLENTDAIKAGDKTVCWVPNVGPRYPQQGSEDHVNVRLIAAAPELLEALEAVVAAGYSWVARDKIETAIKKAKGAI